MGAPRTNGPGEKDTRSRTWGSKVVDGWGLDEKRPV
jgi:hypothetical protein